MAESIPESIGYAIHMGSSIRLTIAGTLLAGTMFAASALYNFKVSTIDNQAVSLGDYHGKVLLVVNVASQCGYTPQYAGLETLYERYKDKGFVVMGFPANNFGAQEPGSNEEIKTFCSRKYSVKFPMFSKVSVQGGDTAPLYQYLTKSANPSVAGDIKWNFTKFLVDRQGNVVARFEPNVTPESPEITAAIEKALAK